MKKKNLLLTCLLAALVLGGVKKAWADNATIDGIYYYLPSYGTSATVAYDATISAAYSGDIVIPSTVVYSDKTYTVTTIASKAFQNSTGLTSIVIPESIISAGFNMYTFDGCTNLSSVTINNNNITAIPKWFFQNCSSLTSVIIPASVTTISDYAFKGCSSLETVSILGNVTSIGQYAFQDCSSLTEITLPTTVTSIGMYAFNGCTNLTSVNIPSNVTSIGGNAFSGCTNLASVNIPSGVTTINGSTFTNCTSLKSITIPSGVTSIGYNAFSGCTGLTELLVLASSPATASSGSFQYIPSSIPVYVPSGSKSAYEAANYWNGFTNYKDLIEYTSPIVFYNGETLNTGIILLTGAGSIRIENGSKIYCDNILGSTPENLIIKDGGRLIVYGSGIQATVEKGIEHATNWGTGTTYVADGWYFIASPVNGAAFPTGSVDNQDIYQLDWGNNRWLNLQNDAHSSLLGAGFQRGTGYLYARRANNTISVAGEIQPLSGSNTATVTLAVSGWNLIGNPLTCNVTVDKDFSELTNASSVTNQEAGTAINPFQGIAVYGDAGDVVTFTKAESQNAVAPSNNNSLQMTLSQTVTTRGSVSSKVVDNAIVKFNGNTSLPKFSMLEGKAKLYIPQGNEQFAIVSAEAHGEIPVNFKANEDGQYTITINAEDLEIGYLHLIDNLTGNDVNLLVNPSYSFNARTTDYASRFRLLFSGNGVNEESVQSDNFAFIGSDGQLIVSGTGTIQIIDMMGRVISTCSTEEHISTNGMTSGVYMLQLVNGSDVKTQKIIVK